MRLFRRSTQRDWQERDEQGRHFDGETVRRAGQRTWADVLNEPTRELPSAWRQILWPRRNKPSRP